MTRPSFGASFARIDAADDPRALIDYLDFVSSVAAVKAAKAESLDLLGLAEGGRAVDIGCGPGDDALAIAARVGASGSVTGLDTSVAAIEEARRRASEAGLPVDFVVADAVALPLADASVDAVRADRTFQHLSAPEAALAEMIRICAPGGSIVISELQNHVILDEASASAATGQVIFERFWSKDERRSWLGYMLPLLMHRAGLETSLTRTRGETGDFDQIDALRQLRATAGRAVQEGAVTQDAAARWLEDVRAGCAQGTVLLRLDFLHFAGRVPG